MSKELSFTLDVKVGNKEIDHELDIICTGMDKSTERDVRDILNDDVDFLIEDIRRRIMVNMR